ncbi:MAG: TIGR03663 family protein [Oligoflexia bacterium]|nr:TIGR03663 family protein [Oligoflexia bacterium]
MSKRFSFEEFTNYFTKREWVVFFVIIFLGIALRWVSLDSRPYHHDESLVGIYGYYTYMDPDNKFYRYNPLLHGPLMFSLLPSIYNVLGVSNWSARAPFALIGTIFLFVPLLFRRFFHQTTLLAFTALWSLSPALIYYSRFIQHDFLIFPSMMLVLYGATLAKDENKSFFVLLGITLQMCIKLNVYVNLVILIAFIAYEVIVVRLFLRCKEEKSTLLSRIFNNILSHPWRLILSIAISTFIFCYLYSAGFKYNKAILDGLYRESIPYWMNQHNMERIKGPYLFNFFFLSWYELIFIVAFIVHYIHFYINATLWYRILALFSFIFSLIIYISYRQEYIEVSFLWVFFKFKIALDSFGPFIFLGHGIAITTYHIMKKEKKLAFFGYMFMANFFTYSYLGEKVPWLALYILFPGTVYLAFYYEKLFLAWENALNYFTNYSLKSFLCYACIVLIGLWSILSLEDFINTDLSFAILNNYPLIASAILILAVAAYLHFIREQKFKYTSTFNLKVWAFVILCLFNLKMAIITNFSRAGSDTELISQVHTTQNFHDIAVSIKSDMETGLKGDRPLLLTLGASIWPMTWYMRDLRSFYSFNLNSMSVSKYYYNYIIDDPNNMDPTLRETHTLQYIPLRHWWVPDYNEMTIRKFLVYSFDHKPWNRSGAMFVLFARKKNT